MEKDLQKLLSLKYGDKTPVYVNWYEEGGGEVFRVHDVYILFYIPQYGGEPQFEEVFNVGAEQQLLEYVYKWN